MKVKLSVSRAISLCRRTITNTETPISLQGLANGMYIAVYRSAKGVQQFRFMKE